MENKITDTVFNKIREEAKSMTQVDIDLINELKKHKHQLYVDEDLDRLYVKKKNPETDLEERIYIKEMIDGFTSSDKWLSEYLPKVDFDISQDGNLRKASEVEAMYKVICICTILGDEFSDILESVVGDNRIKKYDFSSMDSMYIDGTKSNNFRDALKEIQRFDTLMVRSLISACSYKLNDFKEKKDSSFTSMLTEGVASKLESLNRLYCSTIFESDKILANLKATKAKKIKIVKEIDNRDLLLKHLLENPDFSYVVTIFKISKLTSANLGTIKLRRIEKFSIKSAIELAESRGGI